MSLGQSIAAARRKQGLSQESVAEHLGVSRQTISKWETDDTLPDIFQSQKLARLYGLSLDELISFDLDVAVVEQNVMNTSEELTQKIDWTAMWAKKYPVLAAYPTQVDIEKYASSLRAQLVDLRNTYGYSQEYALLVLKDILGKQLKAD